MKDRETRCSGLVSGGIRQVTNLALLPAKVTWGTTSFGCRTAWQLTCFGCRTTRQLTCFGCKKLSRVACTENLKVVDASQAFKDEAASLQSQLTRELQRSCQAEKATDELRVKLNEQGCNMIDLVRVNKAMQEEHTALVEHLNGELAEHESQAAQADARHREDMAGLTSSTDDQLASMKVKHKQQLQSLQKVQELAEAEKRCLRQSIASLQDRLSTSDAPQASQDQRIKTLSKQLQAAKSFGESLMESVRTMQSDNSNGLNQAKKGKRDEAGRQEPAVQAMNLGTASSASTPAAQTQDGSRSMSATVGDEHAACPPSLPAAAVQASPAVSAPTGPQKLASTWRSSRVKALQRESSLANKQANGMAVLEAVPQAPDYWWPADPVFRKIGSGGQGSVYYTEKWWNDPSTGKLKKRPAALKIVPCATEEQLALLNREADNLRTVSWQDEEGRHASLPYAPSLYDQFKDDDSCQGTLAMSLVEGELLDDYMTNAHEKQNSKQFAETVKTTLKRLLQTLDDMHSRHQRSFGDLKPENVITAGKKLVFIDWCSSKDAEQGTVAGAPNTLGYPSPEVTVLGHTQQPSAPLDMHKDDVWAVGVVGLLWLSKGQDLRFGPSRQQAKRLASPQGLADVKKWVVAQHDAWAKAHPGTGGTIWPVQYNKLLEKITDNALKGKAAAFFLAVLHPDPLQRVTAAQALHSEFLQ